MAQDSDNKFKLEVGVEPESSSQGSEQKDISRSVDDFVKDLDKVNKGSSASSDLDRAFSNGYNPNAMMNNTGANNTSKASSLPRKDDGLSKGEPSSSRPDTKGEPSPSQAHEGAPDVGKNYGDSVPDQSHPVRPDGEEPVTKDNGVPQGNPNVTTGDQEANPSGGLPKKNDLEEEKKEDKEESKEEQPKETSDSQDSGPESKSGSEGKNPEAPNDLDKEKIDQQNEAQTGNGYGALKKNRTPQNDENKNDRFYQNMNHSRRVQQGDEDEKKKDTSSSSGSINDNSTPSLGTRIKEGFKNLLSGKADSKDDVSDNSNGRNSGNKNNPFNKALGAAKKAIWDFLKANPHIAAILAVIILILLILIITNLTDEINSNGSNGKCNYSLNGVLSTGSVNLEGLEVEIVNCDAKPGNYTVLETVDFEKYVVGVALAEVSYSRDNPEYFKTQIVAARNFALTRNSSMCPSNPDDCFYGYNPNTGKIRMRACTNDQVYCDYDRPCYRMTRGDSPALVSPEVDSSTSGAYVWKAQPDEALREEILSVAEEVKGKVLLDDSGNVVYTNYIDKDQNEWSRLASEGHTYDEILSIHYGGGSISGATCSSGIIDYGDYVLSSDGHTILHEPLDSFLESQGTSLEAFNGLIEKNVKKAGFGTRAGVVAAAVTLIAELGNNYNVKVPYYWGGGHADGVVIGALGYWGSTQCHTYANNQSYNYCGLDCSGFVPWAIKNGGFNIAQMLAGNFQNMSGVQKVSLSSSPVLEPGDLLESSGHIVLVVGIEESSGNYICAEASGNAAGVLFTRRPFNSSGYWGIKMDGWYATHQRSEG